MKEFKDRLAEAMKIRNTRITDLSNKTGIAKGTISNYLSGRYKAAQTNTYVLADALDVEESWLMGYDVPMKKYYPDVSTKDGLKQLLNMKTSSEELKYMETYDQQEDITDSMDLSQNEINMIQMYRALPEKKQFIIKDLLEHYYKDYHHSFEQ